MITPREKSMRVFANHVASAIALAQKTGFVAPARFTFLADMMQIQCLRADNTDLLEFTLPEGLYGTAKDLAMRTGARTTTFNTNEGDRFILEFASNKDQDQFFSTFQLLSSQGKRAYEAPDLYGGSSKLDREICIEALLFLHNVVQDLNEGGWKNID